MSYWDSEEQHPKTEVRLISPNNFTILYVLSLGLYGAWWMYKTWKFFQEKENLDIMPALRAIFAVFFMFGLLERIHAFAEEHQYPRPYSSIFIFLSFVGFSLFSRFLPEPYTLIGIVAGVLFLAPIEAFNYAIEKSNDYEANIETKFNQNQLFVVVLGGFFWLLIIAGLLSGS